MSYAQKGFVLGSWQPTYIAVAVIAGIVLDRWGLRKSIFIGGFLGPFIVGSLVDLTGSFLAGATFLAMLAVAISALMLLITTSRSFSETSERS